MHYLEVGLEAPLEQVVPRRRDKGACLKDNAAGRLRLMYGARRLWTMDQKTLRGAPECATYLTEVEIQGQARTAPTEQEPKDLQTGSVEQSV